MPTPSASISSWRCRLVLFGSFLVVAAFWTLLPAGQRPAGGYLAAMAFALVAARRLGPRTGFFSGTVILLGGVYLWPTIAGVAPDGPSGDGHLVLLGVALVGLASYMVTPVTTDSSELRRRALFDLATDGILVWSHDGNILEVNPAACELLHYTRFEILSMSVCDLVQDEDRGRVVALRERLQSGLAGTTEWRLRRQDGTFVDVEVSAKRSPDGRWNAIVRDVSERAKAEAALRAQAMELRDVNARLEESQQRLRLAQELAQFGTFEWDVQHDVNRWSPELEALYGVEPGGLGQSWKRFADRVHPDDLASAMNAIHESMEKGLLEGQWRVIRQDGAVRWLACRGWMFRDESGRAARLVGASFDVTDRKQVEEALQKSEHELRQTADRLAEANRLKDEFLATLSHELRTPLQSMIGWSQMLLNGSLPPTGRDKAVQAIHRNATVQAQLIADLLDVSRIISGKLRIAPETVDLVAIVERALDTIRPAAVNKNVALQVSCPSPVVWLVGDADRLGQVIWNLLSNAVKFTAEGGRVDVKVTSTETHASVEVTDTGVGIDSEFIPFVFERFSQADGSTTKPHKGLGLGLAIASHLVQLHGGKISAESRGAGHGATFIVTLPCRHTVHRQTAAPALLGPRAEDRTGAGAAALDRDALKGVSVLLVDDDPEARETLRAVLEAAGARVADAESAQAGLAALAEDWPDALVSDIAMPGEDGYELIRRVNVLKRERGARLGRIALTAFARESDRTLALAAGFDAHLSKPVGVDSLIKAVRAVLDAERLASAS